MSDAEFSVTQGAEFPYDAPDAWKDAYPNVLPIPAIDWAHTAARAAIRELKDWLGVGSEIDYIDEDTRLEIVAIIAEIIRFCVYADTSPTPPQASEVPA